MHLLKNNHKMRIRCFSYRLKIGKFISENKKYFWLRDTFNIFLFKCWLLMIIRWRISTIIQFKESLKPMVHLIRVKDSGNFWCSRLKPRFLDFSRLKPMIWKHLTFNSYLFSKFKISFIFRNFKNFIF